MNCYQHPDLGAVAYCRGCGRALCAVCQRTVNGVVYCPEHVPAPAYSSAPAGGPVPDPSMPNQAAYAATPNPSVANPYVAPIAPVVPSAVENSPGLAFLLGLIPGVGAIYNGQYAKGLVHAVIFGLLVSLISTADSGQPFLGICLAAFFWYMPFEAFHTARNRRRGIQVDEWSSLVQQNRFTSTVPVGPILLIVIGVLFLLQSLHLLDFRQIGRFWPVLLIVIGAAMLFSRIKGARSASGALPVRDAAFVESSRE